MFRFTQHRRLTITGIILAPSLLLLLLITTHIIPLASKGSMVIFATQTNPNFDSSPLQLSSDPYTNNNSQHQTELEPDTYSYGSTIVTAFQAVRFLDAASSNIGWSTSVNGGSTYYDKDWIVCDNSSTSAFYGHCYIEWDNDDKGGLILMSTSTDGGYTWGAALTTLDKAHGLGGQPLVQPNGTVILASSKKLALKMSAIS